jgi:hypothetical protein
MPKQDAQLIATLVVASASTGGDAKGCRAKAVEPRSLIRLREPALHRVDRERIKPSQGQRQHDGHCHLGCKHRGWLSCLLGEAGCGRRPPGALTWISALYRPFPTTSTEATRRKSTIRTDMLSPKC